MYKLYTRSMALSSEAGEGRLKAVNAAWEEAQGKIEEMEKGEYNSWLQGYANGVFSAETKE
jgi:hypothetical protein